MDLTKKKCVPCEGGTPPFTSQQIEEYRPYIQHGWLVLGQKKLRRVFTFKDFVQAMRLVNAIAHIAEEEGHHPDLAISYNSVTVELWTHAIDGLSENDFILAAKIDALQKP